MDDLLFRVTELERRLHNLAIIAHIAKADYGAARVRVQAEALERWEPRFRLTEVRCHPGGGEGRLILDIAGEYRPDGQRVMLEGILV